MNEKFCNSTKRGSILAYALIILAMMLTIAGSMSAVTVIQKKSASSTEFSVQAYQTADSGVQLAIQSINKIIGSGGSSQSISLAIPNCTDSKSINGGGNYSLTFYPNIDGSGTPLTCDEMVSSIKSIKSVGTYKNTVRAVSVVMSTSSGPQKIGMYDSPSGGNWYLDKNGNGAWDPGTDLQPNFGPAGSEPVAGDWNGDGTTDIGVFDSASITWYLDYDGDGAWDGASDKSYNTFGDANGKPVAGDWNGDGKTEIGVFDSSNAIWYLDYDNNGSWDGASDKSYNTFGDASWKPVAGDWNGDGKTEIGMYNPADNNWYLDSNGNGTWDAGTDLQPNFGISGSKPVAGDWNGNGTTDIGVFDSASITWYLDYDGDGAWDGTFDKSYNTFGDSNWKPVAGSW